MAEGTDPESKTEDATPRKLDEARRKGDVAKSPDLPAFATLTAVAGVAVFAGAGLSRGLASTLLPFIAHPDAISLSGAGAVAVGHQAMRACAPALAMVLGAAIIAGVFANVIQTGLMWSPDKMKPDFSKISPMGGFKRIFGIDGMVQFAKSLFKIALVGVITWMVLKPRASQLMELSSLEPAAILPLTVAILKALVFAVAGFLGAGALLDWIWQRHRFMARMRMSKEELKEDYKQSEGDPHIKGKLKQMRIQRSRQRMMQNVPTATVVVMNPTHYAVALRYEAGETAAPVCVAKGLDSLALRIRKIAEDAGVHVIEDPPLARSLYASVEVDQAIPQEHYEVVAKIIGFVLNRARRPAARAL